MSPGSVAPNPTRDPSSPPPPDATRDPSSSPPPDATRDPSGSPPPNPSRESSSSPPPRRVVDIQLDDGDDTWHDEDDHLAGLETTTHRTRNRGAPVIPLRKRRRVVPGLNVRATARKRKDTAVNKMQGFTADLNAWEVECEERAHLLSKKYGMKIKEVWRRMLSSSSFKQQRAPTLYNGKIGRLVTRMNEGRAVGDCYTMLDVKRMVSKKPSLLDSFTEEEEAEILEEMLEKRKLKKGGVRANNLAAAADAKRTVDRLAEEMTALAERTGMISFTMFSRGHIHDTTVPMTIQSWGALDFCRETLRRDPADIAGLFELWAVNRERGATGVDTLKSMQQEATGIITSGLQAIIRKLNAAMNYENYIPAIVEKHNVGLVGWPAGVDFKRMSKQSSMVSLRKLRDALKSGTCRWKVLTKTERQGLVDQFKAMVDNGEVTQKTRKGSTKHAQRATSGKASEKRRELSRKRKGRRKENARADDGTGEEEEEEEEEEARPRRRKRTAVADEEEDETPHLEPSEEERRQRQRKRLMALVQNAKTKGKRSSAEDRAPSRLTKRKRGEADDSGDEHSVPKKSKSKADKLAKASKSKPLTRVSGKAATSGKGPAKKRKQVEDDPEGDNEERAPPKRMKRKAAEDAGEEQAQPKVPRPQPRPLKKPAAAAPTTGAASSSTPVSAVPAPASAAPAASSSAPADSSSAPAASSSVPANSSSVPANSSSAPAALSSAAAPASSAPASAAPTTRSPVPADSSAPASSALAAKGSAVHARKGVVRGVRGRPPGIRP
ncbi:hypothetical protein B0H15DRAFT_954537 [Mycena belliarum]|uniref:Uncharacterized protein n=1 Tax=Mycena belliarum TaxID=1033014 RepID=A0AAD6TX38_9AGAR|nr:hypothetical protein B0H15DRAFT_954537 [Mycena belliae]